VLRQRNYWASYLVQSLAAHHSSVGVHPQVAPASLLTGVAADSSSSTPRTGDTSYNCLISNPHHERTVEVLSVSMNAPGAVECELFVLCLAQRRSPTVRLNPVLQACVVLVQLSAHAGLLGLLHAVLQG
jgi:hypothetical protein